MGQCFGGKRQVTSALPNGPLVAWYGDDFTGAAATMEVLTFAGLPSVLFLEPPTPEQLAGFSNMRGIGVASTARAQSPQWMQEHLPPVFDWLKSVSAKVAHYKICSTFDSSPMIGSIGKAIDIAANHFSGPMPVLVAAPAMRRYQAFGTLFAGSPEGVARLDRHAVMARHPVTPMDEADLRLVLADQTETPVGLITLEDLVNAERTQKALIRETANGHKVVLLDTVSEADLAKVGQLIWENASPDMLAIGSQGVEYALVAHWRKSRWLEEAPAVSSTGSKQMIAVSGSTSIITAAQIEHAASHGFATLSLDAAACLGDETAFGAAYQLALMFLAQGRDILIHSATGPNELGVFQEAAKAAGLSAQDANEKLGANLGRMLRELLTKTGIKRAAISGGDTSGHATRQLGIYALTALAPTLPGASLCKAHSNKPDMHGLQLALKGGQMGSEDYFDWIRQGGGSRRSH